MRKHLSVLGLAARGAVGRILLITVLTAALAGALLYLVPAQTPSQSTVYPDGKVVETYTPSDYCYLPSRTGVTAVCAVGLAGVMTVLSLNGCGYGTKTDLTMRRLRIGEGAANLWWMALNAVCLLFYWAVMAAVTVLVLQLRIRNIVPDNALYTPGRQTLLLAVYASSFLHHLMPVRDTLVWAEDGLLLALCPAYEHTGAEAALVHMRRAAERLLLAQTLEYRGLLLWDTLGKKRPISGAGHGMAGIAAALSWAGKLLGDARCLEAAAAALEFEHGIYSERLGTWPDLRASPVASSAMHGLCSGSPGIGLALLRCRESGLGSPGLEEDLARARHSCLTTGPLRRDHLCCGNSSAVEFLLTLPGCREQAGRLLAFMKARKDGSGGYRYMPENFRKVLCPDLFFGAAGIGFELLRYARPDLLTPVLF